MAEEETFSYDTVKDRVEFPVERSVTHPEGELTELLLMEDSHGPKRSI